MQSTAVQANDTRSLQRIQVELYTHYSSVRDILHAMQKKHHRLTAVRRALPSSLICVDARAWPTYCRRVESTLGGAWHTFAWPCCRFTSSMLTIAPTLRTRGMLRSVEPHAPGHTQ
eukprot:1730040-Pleurochrysis_carterae.AAC.6